MFSKGLFVFPFVDTKIKYNSGMVQIKMQVFLNYFLNGCELGVYKCGFGPGIFVMYYKYMQLYYK